MNISILFLLITSVIFLVALGIGTEFDSSLKAHPEKKTGSKAQKSIADIISKAAGKIDKTRTKQTVQVESKPAPCK